MNSLKIINSQNKISFDLICLVKFGREDHNIDTNSEDFDNSTWPGYEIEEVWSYYKHNNSLRKFKGTKCLHLD